MGMISRAIVAPPRPPRWLAPGIRLESLAAGGRDGPNGEVLRDFPGGQTWSDTVILGTEQDDFQLTLPDIRLPANQYWPLHWHDCWIAVVVLEGSCLVGDWWMEAGDVLITAAGLEYGPLLIGPRGCRMFEIFAKHHLHQGGYAPEYRDHPTLQGTNSLFLERSPVNARNNGRQTLPMDGVDGIAKGRLTPGASWDLGEPDDSDRAVIRHTRLASGEHVEPHQHGDWYAAVVLAGKLGIAGETLARDAMLIVEPDRVIPEIVAGAGGAEIFEVARTAAGIDRQALAGRIMERGALDR